MKVYLVQSWCLKMLIFTMNKTSKLVLSSVDEIEPDGVLLFLPAQ